MRLSATCGMRARIHRGAREIGGSCVEVESGEVRVVLDVGKPLSAGPREPVRLPAVPGLEDGDPSVLAVLVSHPHLDHYGLVDQVHPDVPVYAGQEAAQLVGAARYFSPLGPELRPSGYLRNREPLQLGPFTVTPFLVDHSGFDAYALVVDAGGRRLLYTGDLRGHGRKAALFERMLADPPRGIDTLLMEGTHVRRSGTGADEAVPVLTESDVEAGMAETFRGCSGLPVVVSSAQNVDRLVTVYRAARRAGRIPLVDLYTATVVRAIGRATLPQPGFPSLRVFVPRRQRVRVKESGEFHRIDAVRSYRVFPEDLLAESGRYVVLSGSSTVAELIGYGALRSGVVVWSLWSGYLRDPGSRRIVDLAAEAAVPVIHHHTSGHAPLGDLKRFVTALNPARVVPIHTEGASEYARHFPAVTPRHDGEWWAV